MSTSMSETRIAAIDFETANTDPASICALGISVMEDGVIEDAWYTLVRPDAALGPFSRRNIRVHGITPQDVSDAPEFTDIYRELADWLENSLVCAHNARFDMGCLKAACLFHGRRIPYVRWFDTVELSRRLCPEMRHHRLNDMCEALSIPLDHHHAGSDAFACLSIVAAAMEQTGIYDIEELLAALRVRIQEL